MPRIEPLREIVLRQLSSLNEHKGELLKSAQAHQPLLLLASLSFVIATFLKGSIAATLAAAASILFLVALAVSVPDISPIPSLFGLVVFYAAAGAGCVLLLIVGLAILLGFPEALTSILLAFSIMGAVAFLLFAPGIVREYLRSR